MEACRTATVGEHTLWNSSDGSRHKVCRAAHHPNYDISILHLERPVQMGLRAVRACLPTLKYAGDFLAGKLMTVSGWGLLNGTFNENETFNLNDIMVHKGPNNLQVVKVPGISNEVCEQKYKGEGLISSAELCAGDVHVGGLDSCSGDSGGNLLNI